MAEATEATIDHVIDAVRQAGGDVDVAVDTVEGLDALSAQLDQLEFSRKERAKLRKIIDTNRRRIAASENGEIREEVQALKETPTWKKVLKWGLIIGGVGLAAWLGWKYCPSWDQVQAWIQRLRGQGAAVAASTGAATPAMAAPEVAPKLIEGGVTPTTPAIPSHRAAEFLDALEAAPPPAPPRLG
jgi:hypothetical protein